MKRKKLPSTSSINRPLRESFRFVAAISPALAACGLDYYLTPDLMKFVAYQGAYLFGGYLLFRWINYSDVSSKLNEKTRGKVPPRISAKFDELCQKAGLENAEIVFYWAQGPESRNNRVILNDYFMNTTTEKEQDFVIGHEISHIRNRDVKVSHIIKGISFAAFAGFVGQFIQLPFIEANISTFYKVMAYAMAGISIELGTECAWWRSVEYRCDEDGVVLNGNANGGISLLKDWATKKKDAESSQSWLAPHPSSQKRLDNLKRKFC